MAVAHALELAGAYLREPSNMNAGTLNGAKRVVVSAGDGVSCNRTHVWLARGDWLLQLAVASKVAVLFGELALLPCCPPALSSH